VWAWGDDAARGQEPAGLNRTTGSRDRDRKTGLAWRLSISTPGSVGRFKRGGRKNAGIALESERRGHRWKSRAFEVRDRAVSADVFSESIG